MGEADFRDRTGEHRDAQMNFQVRRLARPRRSGDRDLRAAPLSCAIRDYYSGIVSRSNGPDIALPLLCVDFS